jgi:photosystem II stability/assembly factor-like uncharacterized protein
MKSRKLRLAVGLAAAVIAAVQGVPGSARTLEAWDAVHGPEGGYVAALAADPRHPETLYAGALWGGWYRSTNGGDSWQRLSIDTKAAVRGALLVDPRRAGTVYLGSGSGIFKSTNGGRTWRNASVGLFRHDNAEARGWRLGEGWVTKLVFAPGSSRVIYAATYGGLFETRNAGRSWLPVQTRIRFLSSVAVDPRHPHVLYIATLYTPKAKAHVFKTTNEGGTWQPLGFADRAVTALFVDPRRSDSVFAAADDGVYRSGDAGRSWVRVLARPTGALTFVPESGLLYAGTAEGLYATRDGGATWARARPELEPAMAVGPVAVAGEEGTLFAATDDGIYRKRGAEPWTAANRGLTATSVGMIAADGNVYAGVAGAGVFRSVDGAHTWQAANDGLTSRGVSALGVDRHNGVVYLGTWDYGVFGSDERGARWRPTTLKTANIRSIAVAEGNASVVYVAAGVSSGDVATGRLFKSADGGSTWAETSIHQSVVQIAPTSAAIYVGTENGVFKSVDGGETWSEANSGLLDSNDTASMAGTWSLAVAPSDSRVLYVVTNKGFFRSFDAARSWQPRTFEFRGKRVQRVIVDPENSAVVYGATDTGRVVRSTDGGGTWSLFDHGLDGHDIGAFTIDGGTLYAGQIGGGVAAVTLDSGT